MTETIGKSARKSGERVDLRSPSLYLNRELGRLEYNARVLAQAGEERHPVLERLRFLGIASRDLDEFFMVRVSDLLSQIDAGLSELPPDGMTPAQQLSAIRRRVMELLTQRNTIYSELLVPQLAANGVRIMDLQELSVAQRAGLRTYFERQVFPVLTPLAVDPGHPFPHISNLSVNLAVELASEGSETRFARLKIPDVIPRLIHVEWILEGSSNGKKTRYTFVWLDQLVAHNLAALFPGIKVLGWYPFKVVRDADIEYHEEEGVDLRVSVERGLRQRRFGEAVQLLVEKSMPGRMRALLAEQLNMEPAEIYAVDPPLDLDGLMQLTSIDRPDLKYAPFVPKIPSTVAVGEPLFSTVDRHDVLLHHPYDSFAPVVDLLTAAAHDDSVLAIKQTLYRVGTDSPIVQALLEAVNQGKQVAVLVELKARFDEKSNIEWARELERAGVHVVYGFVGLKTHAKVALIVRKDRDGIRRYLHAGTGNYNVATARVYSDISLFTADRDFGADATDLFNFLTGYSEQASYRRFLVAPVNLRQGLLERIDREIEHRKRGGQGHLIFKMNGLVDQEFIEALYRASGAGVKVDLLVRRESCLRPGLPGVSDNIRVRSLIGRFLEHSRIYYFHNGGEVELFAGSADLMPRNLDHRVEVLFPVIDSTFQKQILNDILEPELRDTANAWEEQSDGSYQRLQSRAGEKPFDSQAWSMTHGI
jgi:polyphosphate kinase